MGAHPIDELMKTAMESIRDMVDVNTIVGDAVQTADDTVIIPVSRVAFGFAAGGGDYQSQKESRSASVTKVFLCRRQWSRCDDSSCGFYGRQKQCDQALPVEYNSTIDRVLILFRGFWIK